LRRDLHLCTIKVFVLSSATNEEEQTNAYAYQIEGYFAMNKLNCHELKNLLQSYLS